MYGMQKANDTSTFFQDGQSVCWDIVIQTSFRPFKTRLQNSSTPLIFITQNHKDYWQNISLKNLSADSVSSVIAALRRMKQQLNSPASTIRIQVNIRSLPFSNSFHGRTIATVTATAQPKYHKGFAPLLEGFSYVPFNDLEALKKQ